MPLMTFFYCSAVHNSIVLFQCHVAQCLASWGAMAPWPPKSALAWPQFADRLSPGKVTTANVRNHCSAFWRTYARKSRYIGPRRIRWRRLGRRRMPGRCRAFCCAGRLRCGSRTDRTGRTSRDRDEDTGTSTSETSECTRTYIHHAQNRRTALYLSVYISTKRSVA